MSSLSSRLANGVLKKYHGVEGGVFFRGEAAARLTEKFPVLKTMNNALWAAPAWKWGQRRGQTPRRQCGRHVVEKLNEWLILE
jgi:hypothetical protein